MRKTIRISNVEHLKIAYSVTHFCGNPSEINQHIQYILSNETLSTTFFPLVFTSVHFISFLILVRFAPKLNENSLCVKVSQLVSQSCYMHANNNDKKTVTPNVLVIDKKQQMIAIYQRAHTHRMNE